MFWGEYKHNIDAKGRLSIPAKMRNQCGDSVFVIKGNDGCLTIYTEEGWEKYYQENLMLSRKKKKNRTFIRLISSKVAQCEFDKLGRINIPPNLRKEANLQKECTIIGAMECIEVWDSEAWEAFYEENNDHFDDISEDLDEDEE